jgi:hypothetical protein
MAGAIVATPSLDAGRLQMGLGSADGPELCICRFAAHALLQPHGIPIKPLPGASSLMHVDPLIRGRARLDCRPAARYARWRAHFPTPLKEHGVAAWRDARG